MSGLEEVCDTLRGIEREATRVGGDLHRRAQSLHRASQHAASVVGVGTQSASGAAQVAFLLRAAADATTRAAHLLEQAAKQGDAFVARTIGGRTGGPGPAGGSANGGAAARGSIIPLGVAVSDEGGVREDIVDEIHAIAALHEAVRAAVDPVTGRLDPAVFVALINPGSGIAEVAGDGAFWNNCGLCAQAVASTLAGKPAIAAGVHGMELEEMATFTGRPQIPHTPDSIADRLRAMPPGSNAIVGTDWVGDGGHWFNAYWDGYTVWYVDGQSGRCEPWPPRFEQASIRWDAVFTAPGQEGWGA